MNKKFKSEKGISLLKLCLIIIFIVFLVLIIYSKVNKSSNTTSTSSYLTKESRSSYISKCTTIDYTSLARNPNQYKGNDYKFTGEVIQAMNDDPENVVLRVNVTPKTYTYSKETYYEDTILVYYQYSSSYESKILEDDIITIYGQSMGTYTYEAVLGNSVTIPAILAMYIDIN